MNYSHLLFSKLNTEFLRFFFVNLLLFGVDLENSCNYHRTFNTGQFVFISSMVQLFQMVISCVACIIVWSRQSLQFVTNVGDLLFSVVFIKNIPQSISVHVIQKTRAHDNRSPHASCRVSWLLMMIFFCCTLVVLPAELLKRKLKHREYWYY